MSSPHRIPDFFIIGAPKCGTTALYSYLDVHPATFMSPVKEPHHFTVDFYMSAAPNARVGGFTRRDHYLDCSLMRVTTNSAVKDPRYIYYRGSRLPKS